MDGYDFTIPYIIDTTSNSPTVHELMKQAKKNVWIIFINGKYPITSKVALV